MSSDSLVLTVERNLNPVGFAEGLYDGMIGQPLNAIRQLAGDKVEPAEHSKDWLAMKVGSLAGMAVDFAILSRMCRGLLKPVLGTSAEGIIGSNTIMAFSGGVYGGLLIPSSHDRNLLQGRLENGLLYATSFAAFGAALGSANHGLGLLTKSSPVQNAYYRAKWNIELGMTEAKRSTYTTLDKLGMRHPFQRLGDFVYGTEVADTRPRPKLTAGNNPITAFEKELPQYFRDVEANEQQYINGDKNIDRYELYKQLGEIHTKFAHRLLTIWHGTAENPGIKGYAAAELATPNSPPERVAQIRQALTLRSRGRVVNHSSSFDESVKNLLPVGEELAGDNFSLLEGLSGGRERFFQYD